MQYCIVFFEDIWKGFGIDVSYEARISSFVYQLDVVACRHLLNNSMPFGKDLVVLTF